jgi:hypothetical protein
MSWEVTNKKSIKCLCGKGSIVQETIGDDWNRHKDKEPIIECEECSQKYKIDSEYICPKPYHDYTNYYCVEKENPSKKITLDL